MGRSKTSQSKHDAAVKRLARQLEGKGFKVKADVSGYEQPSMIDGLRPDIDAKRGNQRKVIEVETPDSVNTARGQKQKQALQNAAERSKNTEFIRKVTGG